MPLSRIERVSPLRRLLSALMALMLLAQLLAALVAPSVALAAETYLFKRTWGSQGAANGQFNFPRDIAMDSTSNIYVVDRDNHRIQKFTSAGVFLVAWGSQGSGNGQFSFPVGIAI